MIHIDRNSVPVPGIFSSSDIEIAIQRMSEFYSRSQTSRSQEKYYKPLEPELRDQFVKPLRVLFNGKCAYCESLIDQAMPRSQSQYDHFRPKNGARGFEKEFSPDHYWWLTYEWNNLYYSCEECNRYKSAWFPVEGERAKIKTRYADIIKTEKPLLIDPCQDDPEEHLLFNREGLVTPLTKKGEVTIEILKLNRSELVEKRKNTINELLQELMGRNDPQKSATNMPAAKAIISKWNELFSEEPIQPYLAAQRQIFSEIIESGPAIRPKVISKLKNYSALKKELKDPKETFTSITLQEDLKHIYLDKIEVKNFKCFAHLEIDFKTDTNLRVSRDIINEPWILFLGENSMGKSSLLKAIVIGLCGQEYLDGLDISPGDILKHGEKEGYIRISLVGSPDPIEVSFNKRKITSSIQYPIVNVLAYNAIRLKPSANKIEPETGNIYGVRAKNLFDYTFSLIDADQWLVSLPKEAFNRAALTLKDLMLLENDDKIEIRKKKVVIKRRGQELPVEELSDGYKYIFYLAVDIMATLVDENITFDLAEGIVLIDEIGNHLHPRWRMEVVGKLRKCFPKIRFVVTTHEPLCLRGLEAGEAVVLTIDEYKEIVAITDLPNPANLRVDQLLTSGFFGLYSTIDPKTEKVFDEYYKVLALDEEDRSDEQKERLVALTDKVRHMKHLGDTPREEIICSVTDELLAKNKEKDGFVMKEELKKEVVNKVQAIWKTL